MRFLWGLGLRSESRQFIAVCSADPHPAPCVDGELSVAEVVEWQTRTFEGRVAQAVRVQVPPSAPTSAHADGHSTHCNVRWDRNVRAPPAELPCSSTHKASDLSGGSPQIPSGYWHPLPLFMQINGPITLGPNSIAKFQSSLTA